jgi:hypothetical protein
MVRTCRGQWWWNPYPTRNPEFVTRVLSDVFVRTGDNFWLVSAERNSLAENRGEREGSRDEIKSQGKHEEKDGNV